MEMKPTNVCTAMGSYFLLPYISKLSKNIINAHEIKDRPTGKKKMKEINQEKIGLRLGQFPGAFAFHKIRGRESFAFILPKFPCREVIFAKLAMGDESEQIITKA
jgi:hypothetical protein